MKRWHLTLGLAAVALVAVLVAPRLEGMRAAPVEPQPVAQALQLPPEPPTSEDVYVRPQLEILAGPVEEDEVWAPAPPRPPVAPPPPGIAEVPPQPQLLIPELDVPMPPPPPPVRPVVDFWEDGCPACGMG